MRFFSVKSSICFMVAGAMLSGVLSLVVVGIGIASTPLGGRGAPTIAIILGAALSYFVLIAVTTAFFHRVLTAELLVIVVWAAVELLVVNALYACGRFAAAQAVGCVAAVALASLIGLACYVLYYRLNGYPSFWDGLVPLAVDALATAGLLFAQAASKAG